MVALEWLLESGIMYLLIFLLLWLQERKVLKAGEVYEEISGLPLLATSG